MQRRQKRKKAPILDPLVDALPPPKNFGDQVTGDHFIKKGGGDFDEADDPNFLADSVAVVLFDRATRWLAVYPKSTKTTYHTIEAFQHFAGAKDKIRSFHCDNAPELLSAARALHWRLSTATPGMPQTNGVAENCVRRTKEGGGCAIVQSGLNPRTFWPEAGEHYCFPQTSLLSTATPATTEDTKRVILKVIPFPLVPLWTLCHNRKHVSTPWELRPFRVFLLVATSNLVVCGTATT